MFMLDKKTIVKTHLRLYLKTNYWICKFSLWWRDTTKNVVVVCVSVVQHCWTCWHLKMTEKWNRNFSSLIFMLPKSWSQPHLFLSLYFSAHNLTLRFKTSNPLCNTLRKFKIFTIHKRKPCSNCVLRELRKIFTSFFRFFTYTKCLAGSKPHQLQTRYRPATAA